MDSRLDKVRACLAGTAWEGKVFCVGGCVRDDLLGLPPSQDADLVLEGSSEEVAQHLFSQGAASAPPQVYSRFGTAMVMVDGLTIELASARTESYSSDSRKPDTAASSLDDDAKRRDFTINALMRNLHTGEILDLLGQGLSDLEARLLRTPLDPAATFADDPLRMLRAVRFRHRLGFSYAPGLEDAIRAMAPRTSMLSAERIRDELEKMLALESGPDALDDLMRLGLLEQFAPELAAMKGVEQGNFHHLDVWDHTLLVMRKAGAKDRLLTLACLLHDCGKPATRQVDSSGRTRFFGHERKGEEIAKDLLLRLRFSRSTALDAGLLVRSHMRLSSLGDKPTKGALRRLVRDLGAHLDQFFALVEADTLALKPGVEVMDVGLIRAKVEAMLAEDGAAVYESPISGGEIQKLFGLAPGPQVGRIKDALREAVIEGELEQGDVDGARRLAKRLFKQPDGAEESGQRGLD